MGERIIYLDHAASSPPRPESLEAERAFEASPICGANPNSLHTLGREAARALDSARSDLARCIGGGFRPPEVTFTSGGTESNNLAVIGLAEGARSRKSSRRRVVVSAIEHDSVLDLVGPLRQRGFEVTLVRPRRDGKVSCEALEEAMDEDVGLVSVMSANNETGVIQPISSLAEIAHGSGAVFHTDAVQAFCRVPLATDNIDAVSVAAHKIGGPVGVGALIVRSRVALRPQSFGGGQELGRRAGTQDVRGALAFAAVATSCIRALPERREVVSARAEALYARICAPGTGIEPTTTTRVGFDRLPGIVSVVVPSLDSETMILELDQAGFAVSAASACSSGSLEPSHVLMAMGIDRRRALGSLRISFDERVSPKDLDRFGDVLTAIVCKHR